MSDFLKHECGVAVVRLRKPLQYYYDKYGTALWGFNKLMLLMEKQHNRGHDGVGMGSMKLGMPLGAPYIFRRRDAKKDSLAGMFRREMKSFNKMERNGILSREDPASIKNKFDFGGEILMGHLRYGTSGEFSEGSCHPYLRRSNWPTRTLLVLGNFNMTNAGELNRKLIERGQHPVFGTDTQTVLEEIGFHLDEAHSDIYRSLRDNDDDGQTRQDKIAAELDISKIVAESAEYWDGGYTIAGVVGNGDLFVTRDPRGIRPCFMYQDDEVIAFASERVPLMTVFESEQEEVAEVPPGAVITVNSEGQMAQASYHQGETPSPCSFERIYFSRGNDPSIYKERKRMGAALVPQVVESIGDNFEKAVFSFIPNTAETAYYGLMDGLRLYRREQVKQRIAAAAKEGRVTDALLDELIMTNWPRGEKVAHKDIKMRTFISQEKGRAQLVSHVYDITYGLVGKEDSLVVLDDSIVRGTTLKKSILKILARTKPKKIVICSTAPQIRYPDCYGIDMSEMGKFIAFRAAESLRKKRGEAAVFEETYQACKAELAKPAQERENAVKMIYEGLSDEEISAEVASLVTPEDIDWHGEIEVIYQTIDNLHQSIDEQSGDWYFTGDYPTQGGVAVANAAYINYFEGKDGRSYDLPL
ncbi:amidophosphoribosyltransferase [Roseibacillus ishigakijimensis]|uniref:Amidophosphoribosyltransferase n=1 Tax=Roseibacillus ishigakijimensis TaxID=454146 RepID=A0A934RNS0_9BACT|nr:amidophosphoribosyltransferase [Roseibacillus ishigakijimensis]MBK1835177.1 amidophosphoribosyltransferase [Roseibacillus ishigakijimensis]